MNDNQDLAVRGKNETATAAAAENAKALIESAYIMALKFPRSEDRARQKVLASCKRPVFAESALYRRPVGSELIKGKWEKKYVIGLSIRAAEEALRFWGNLRATVQAIYEDEEKRIINISVIDLETNAMYAQDVTVIKVIEKKKLKDGEKPVYNRVNSYGEVVYGVQATADEQDKKQGIAISKMIRNHVLRLLPSELKEEMITAIQETKMGVIESSPAEARKKLIDAFYTIGVNVDSIEKLVEGQKLETLSPAQISELREIYTTIRAGQASYRDYIQEDDEKNEKGKLKKAKKQPVKGELKPGGDTIAPNMGILPLQKP